MTLFFFPPPDEVSHWQAAYKSGKESGCVCSNGEKWRLRNLQGFAYAVVQPTEQTSRSAGGTDVEGLTAVNVGLQEGRWMVRRWDGDGGARVEQTCSEMGRWLCIGDITSCIGIIVASLKASRGSARGVDVSTFRVGEGVA